MLVTNESSATWVVPRTSIGEVDLVLHTGETESTRPCSEVQSLVDLGTFSSVAEPGDDDVVVTPSDLMEVDENNDATIYLNEDQTTYIKWVGSTGILGFYVDSALKLQVKTTGFGPPPIT